MLKLENLKKVYDGVTILENINLNIEDGEIISILGPSGCGKTTLLNLILGIAEADGGHIVFNGQDITDVPMEKRGFNICLLYTSIHKLYIIQRTDFYTFPAAGTAVIHIKFICMHKQWIKQQIYGAAAHRCLLYTSRCV